MKGLPPSLRKRKRYIAFRVLATEPVDSRSLIQEIWQTALTLYGEYFAAGLGIWLEQFDGSKGILRCSRDALEKVKVVLTLISNVAGVEVVIVTLGVSGTIKGCKKYLEVLENASTTDGI
ncbi:Rpp14/Pop5 family protein [Archaeoglobus veneficus]|nr:Rpp14/Pop5 family protein [Archaeoglobus veneficus]